MTTNLTSSLRLCSWIPGPPRRGPSGSGGRPGMTYTIVGTGLNVVT